MSERIEKGQHPGGDFLEQNRQLIVEFRTKGGRKLANFGDSLLLLTTVGARTERARTVPLVFSKDGDRYVVAASNAGSPRDPHWLHNLRANPSVWIEVGQDWIEAKGSIVDGAERERLFDLHVQRLPQLRDYQAMTVRPIPIVVMEPRRNESA